VVPVRTYPRDTRWRYQDRPTPVQPFHDPHRLISVLSRLRDSKRSATRKFARTGIASLAAHATLILTALYSLDFS